MIHNLKNEIGKRYGRLVVTVRADSKNGFARWVCKCDCGNISIATGTSLRRGYKNSCGCIQKEGAFDRCFKHGKVRTSIHRIWIGMRQRCNNPKNPAYKYYGGRGIKVCKRWNKFENFFEDMGEMPEGRSLDRRMK